MNRPALKFVLTVKEPAVTIRQNPVRLVPIPWGKCDPALARAVCRHLAEVTPPTIIPANPLNAAKVRAFLTSHHIEHQ